mmetsp:Transcript_17301/g.52096  ORF Transcript_17301/g.52096 Transcript_17301/m.52096 type:complete len:339 (-) Transcript_17301:121-1137(-)
MLVRPHAKGVIRRHGQRALHGDPAYAEVVVGDVALDLVHVLPYHSGLHRMRLETAVHGQRTFRAVSTAAVHFVRDAEAEVWVAPHTLRPPVVALELLARFEAPMGFAILRVCNFAFGLSVPRVHALLGIPGELGPAAKALERRVLCVRWQLVPTHPTLAEGLALAAMVDGLPAGEEVLSHAENLASFEVLGNTFALVRLHPIAFAGAREWGVLQAPVLGDFTRTGPLPMLFANRAHVLRRPRGGLDNVLLQANAREDAKLAEFARLAASWNVWSRVHAPSQALLRQEACRPQRPRLPRTSTVLPGREPCGLRVPRLNVAGHRGCSAAGAGAQRRLVQV